MQPLFGHPPMVLITEDDPNASHSPPPLRGGYAPSYDAKSGAQVGHTLTRATAASATAQDLRNLRRIISRERDEELAREIILRKIGGRVFETLHALKQGVSEDNKGTVWW